jgi:hypothetical protein
MQVWAKGIQAAADEGMDGIEMKACFTAPGDGWSYSELTTSVPLRSIGRTPFFAGRARSSRGYGTQVLSIAFGAIVGDTEHLAVLGRACAAFAPCGNVVRVHFL